MGQRKAFYILIALILSGCSPWIRTEQPVRSGFFPLQAGGSLGQTFVARYDGLSGVAVYLRPEAAGQGKVLFHLQKSPLDPQDLALTEIPFEKVSEPGYYRFQFAPIQRSTGQDFSFQLAVDGQGSIAAGQAEGNAYLNGAAYREGDPQDAQLSFRLLYDPNLAVMGLIREGIFWLGLVAAGAFLFIVPGWSLLGLTFPGWGCLKWPEKLGLSGGVSLALYPLLFLWTGFLGLRLGPLYAWGPPLVGLGALVWKRTKDGRSPIQNPVLYQNSQPADERRKTKDALVRPSSFVFRPPSFVLHPSSIALLLVLSLVIFVRFWIVRGLDAPLFGDSYQHSLIAQLLVDHGGLFDSWQPYADLSSFTYHFGFHTAVAAFHWITRLSTPQAALWTGQILNALAALSLYPLASRIGRSPWAGVFAVLLAGLLSPMPMFYANWGRFTQLAGQVILAAAVYLLWDLLESKHILTPPIPRAALFAASLPPPGGKGRNIAIPRTPLSLGGRVPVKTTGAGGEGDGKPLFRSVRILWSHFLLTWLVLGGLALTHYRVLIFAVLFLAAYFFLSFTSGRLRELVGKIFWVGAGAGLLFLPWFIHVFAGRMMRILAVKVSAPPSPTSGAALQVSTMGNLLDSLPAWIWLLLPLVIGWGLWRREKGAALVSLWWFINLVAANPQWLGLPGAGSIDGYTVMIAAYFPASVLIGACAGWLIHKIDQRTAEPGLENTTADRRQRRPPVSISQMAGLPLRRTFTTFLLILVVVTGLWGARERARDLHPAEYALVTRPDIRAAAWIRDHTPTRSRFLVNAFFAFNDTTVVGSDAGWWLPLLAERGTTLPPINYAFEAHQQSGPIPLVNALTAKIQEKGLQDPEVLNWLKELQVTHIYIGQQQGRVNYAGPHVLDPQKLLESGHFRPVYHQDRVWIFEILP